MKLEVLVFLITMSAHAQVTTAALTGAVTDPSNGAIAGAAIKVVQEATGFFRTTESDALGNYILEQLAPGVYTLTVTRPGFAEYIATGIVLELSHKARHD